MTNEQWYRRPEVWSAIVSAVALTISVRSCSDVRDQLNLFRGQVRAYVEIVDADLEAPILDASYLTIRLRLKNAGQTAAVDIVGDMDYALDAPGSGEGNSATRKSVAPMGPGIERVISLYSNRINRRDWPVPYARRMPLYFFGTVWYRDETTGDQRKEDYCYELALHDSVAFHTTRLEACGTLTYKSR
jgi:hypothetical protein